MPAEAVERKLAAILAADIAGYSRLIGLDEEGTLARLRALRRDLIDPAIAEHRGRIVKTTGDGLLVEFPSVVYAVRCGVSVQRAVAERETALPPDRRIEFRVGINLGDIVVDGDDILGDGVNIAARLEGITEPGAMSAWMAAATSYSVSDVPMLPFYIYYSMFGFQRIGDLAWAAGDIQARGFLIGGTAGRTTLEGEGLQHEDGHSHILSSTIPNCVSYDPTYMYEVAVIVQDGLRRMFKEQENVFYYLTCMNENYVQPAIPKGAEQGILKGLYLLKQGGKQKLRVQLMGSGTILREVEAAAEMLEKDWGVSADVWSATSFTELRRDGLDCARWNMFHAGEKPRVPYVTESLAKTTGPIVVATDYMKLFADQIREFVPRRYTVLGTDGFGRSDTRTGLRHFFEVDRRYVTVAALKSLMDEGQLDAKKVAEAIKKYGLNPDKPNPVTV